MRLIISGSRKFEHYALLKAKVSEFLKSYDPESVTVIAGGAKGADTLAVKYAKEKGFKFKVYPAMWDRLNAPGAVIKTNNYGQHYNAVAGLDRNLEMAKNADALMAFWDGLSPGTSNMIKVAKERLLIVNIVKFA